MFLKQLRLTKLTFVLFPLMFLSAAKAQQPLQFSFTHYNTGSGLISNQVNTIVQDHQGYLWIGTTDGLQRFDGTRYKTFRHRENDVLSIDVTKLDQITSQGVAGMSDEDVLRIIDAAARKVELGGWRS